MLHETGYIYDNTLRAWIHPFRNEQLVLEDCYSENGRSSEDSNSITEEQDSDSIPKEQDSDSDIPEDLFTSTQKFYPTLQDLYNEPTFEPDSQDYFFEESQNVPDFSPSS